MIHSMSLIQVSQPMNDETEEDEKEQDEGGEDEMLHAHFMDERSQSGVILCMDHTIRLLVKDSPIYHR